MPNIVKCPNCQVKVEWRQDNPYRPFCSERCKNKDFIAWANEEQKIPGDTSVSDIFSEDLDQY